MKKAVALSALVCSIAVIFTAAAAAIDIAGSHVKKIRLDNTSRSGLQHERLMYFTPPNAAVIDTMILGTLALNAALNKLHRIPQPQITAPPRRHPAQ